MIVSFGDPATEDLFHGRSSRRVRKFPGDIIPSALRRLDMLNAASELRDLRSPPANRLEKLGGQMKGYYSIRVNDQWRLVFRWEMNHARLVSLTDYH